MNRRKFIIRASGAGLVAPYLSSVHLKENFNYVEGELLYNGIRLANVWPPRNLHPESEEPMPVPYLSNVPKILPIDIGRQLFVDDFLIQKTNLTREYHSAKKFEGNPVFSPFSEDEVGGPENKRSVVYTGHGGVFYDWEEGLYKMYYRSGWLGGLALATSKDMIHWERPDLGLAGGNLILPKGHVYTGEDLLTAGSDNCVWLDMQAPPSQRLKFLTCWLHAPVDQRPKHTTHSLHVSDGKTWSKGRPTGIVGDYCSFFYNPFRKKWIYSIRISDGPRGRCRYYAENHDFLGGADWSDAVYWTNTDRLDQPEPKGAYPGAGDPPELYSLSAIAYESIFIGMHQILRGPKNKVCDEGKFPKLTDLEIGYSRDGFHWQRPCRQAFIAGERKEGVWDRAYVHAATGVFVVSGDKLIFPYTSFSGIAPNGYKGSYTGSCIGIAFLRRDGFASMNALNKSGFLVTRPVVFSGSRIFINASAIYGSIRVEVLDENMKAVFPFTMENCLPFSGDSTIAELKWRDGKNLAALAGKVVRFRFEVSNGSLYAFWVSKDSTGRSDGYLAAGGAGHSAIADRVGLGAFN